MLLPSLSLLLNDCLCCACHRYCVPAEAVWGTSDANENASAAAVECCVNNCCSGLLDVGTAALANISCDLVKAVGCSWFWSGEGQQTSEQEDKQVWHSELVCTGMPVSNMHTCAWSNWVNLSEMVGIIIHAVWVGGNLGNSKGDRKKVCLLRMLYTFTSSAVSYLMPAWWLHNRLWSVLNVRSKINSFKWSFKCYYS